MLDYVDKPVLSSMEGVLGIKTNYSTSSSSYTQLQKNFQAESNFLLAYDSITIVTKALEKMNTNSSISKMLLEEILSSNFNGLIGDIRFKERQLSYTPILSVIKVVDNDKKHMELDFWTPKSKFARYLSEKTSDGTIKSLNDSVHKTWKIPTKTNPLKVAIPMYASSDNFLKVSQNQTATGFCIDLFNEIREILSDQYSGLPYRFYPLNASYDSILLKVIDEVK
jgi:ionotropic glutamate receptor